AAASRRSRDRVAGRWRRADAVEARWWGPRRTGAASANRPFQDKDRRSRPRLLHPLAKRRRAILSCSALAKGVEHGFSSRISPCVAVVARANARLRARRV